MEGWLKLHRRVLHSKQFANPLDLKVWIWLLCKASTQDRNVTVRIGPHTHSLGLVRGQVIFGRTSAERELCIDGSTVYKVVQRMSADGLISIQSNNHFSIITLIDYVEDQDFPRIEDFEIYESVAPKEQPSNNHVAGPEQDRNRTVAQCKKVKKEKKVEKVEKGDKKEEAGAFAPVPPLNTSPDFVRFHEWVETHAPRVNRMREPFTEKQFEQIRGEWPAEAVRDMLKQMHNWQPLFRKNRCAYLTCDKWLKKDKKAHETNRSAPPGSHAPKQGTSAARVEALRNWGHTGTGHGAGG